MRIGAILSQLFQELSTRTGIARAVVQIVIARIVLYTACAHEIVLSLVAEIYEVSHDTPRTGSRAAIADRLPPTIDHDVILNDVVGIIVLIDLCIKNATIVRAEKTGVRTGGNTNGGWIGTVPVR